MNTVKLRYLKPPVVILAVLFASMLLPVRPALPDSDNPVLVRARALDMTRTAFDDPSDRDYVPPQLPPPLFERVKLDDAFEWSPGDTLRPQKVSYPGARWMKIHFLSSTNLGRGSTLTIRSEEDGQTQTLNSETLQQWSRSSALFNGDTVSITVKPGPGDRDITIGIEEVSIGVPPPPEGDGAAASLSSADLCNVDHRATSGDRAVGRILLQSCTGWLLANGAVVSAGHCNNGYMETIEFEVKPSDADGTINAADTEDQYAIYDIRTQAGATSAEAGKDWAVFGAYPNTETGLLPAQKQKSFYRVSDLGTATDIALPGFGFDNDPRGPSIETSWANDRNFTQQLVRVPFVNSLVFGVSDAVLEYSAYRRGGESGGPVVDIDSGLGIGISTRRCNSSNIAVATSFLNQALRDAIETFPGPDTVYVDKGHPSESEDGSIYRPYESVIDGLGAASAGGILSIVTGHYAVPANTLIGKPVKLTAPVGPVTIRAP